MPEPLSSTERDILEFLIEYLRRNTFQPSIREIGRKFDIKSTKTVSEYLQSLADKGWIERNPSRSRGVRLLGVDLGPDTSKIPCYDELDADGMPTRPEAPLDAIGIDRRLVHSPGSFFFVMAGESMNEAGIHPGDLLLIAPADEATLDDGDIVVVSLAGRATVKRFVRRGKEIVLESASPDYPPVLVHDADELVVAGRVDVVFRQLHAPRPTPVAASADGQSGGTSR